MTRPDLSWRRRWISPSALLLTAACGGPGDGAGADAGGAPWDLETASFATVGVEDGHPDLFLVSRRTDTLWIRLTAEEGLDNSPSWSPDGRALVFHSDRTAQGRPDLDIFLIEPGGGRPARRLTYTEGFDYLPSFSPDGRWIAFLSRRADAEWPEGSPGHIYVMRADGSSARRVTRIPVSASLGPRWMPDGQSLLYARRTEEEGPTVLVKARLNFGAPAGSPMALQEEILVSDGFFNYTPAPSPNGRRLAYTAEGEGRTRVVVMDADGRNARVLLDDGFNYVEEWTPDGRWIVVTRWFPAFQRRDAWLISADGSEPDLELLSPVHRSSSAVAFRPSR